jgi:PadR family transcriptional regulator AphA
MLRLGARSGYEIKRYVELSIRFFWTVSPAQIYPSLEQLEGQGLVKGRSEPRGRRPRRVYEITDRGEAALEEWLRRDDPIPFELRDLGMVKLFFADILERDEALELTRLVRRRSEERVRILRQESHPGALEADEQGIHFPLLTLRMGIAYHEAMAEACREFERELEPTATHA